MSINLFAFYYREAYNIIDEKLSKIGEKITIFTDEQKLYRQIISIYSLDDYYFMVEAILSKEGENEKNLFFEKFDKDNFLAVTLSIKSKDIEEYYIFLIKSKEGFLFSNCGKKADLTDFYNILANNKLKQVRDFLEILLNDENNGIGLFFMELFKPKNKYIFEEVKLACGRLEKVFSVPCLELKK